MRRDIGAQVDVGDARTLVQVDDGSVWPGFGFRPWMPSPKIGT